MKKIIPDNAILIPEDAERVFQGKIFDVYQWPQALFDDSKVTFEMLKRPDTVVAICVVDNQILVINDEQPHHGSRKSFPGGRVDQGDESIEAAAQREVAEETGYSFRQWRLIKVWQPHTKIEWFVHLFLAWDVAGREEPHLDAGEKITLERHSFQDLKTLTLNKVGYLGDAQDTFAKLDSLDQLLEVPLYSGQPVNR